MADKRRLALETWYRYQYLRDHGHLKYVRKTKKCEEFFEGNQWSKEDREALREQKRPALTINKILSFNLMNHIPHLRTSNHPLPQNGHGFRSSLIIASHSICL